MTGRGEPPLSSGLYEGTITHWRSTPAHRFHRRIALPLLFLDELQAATALHPLVDLDPAGPPSRIPSALQLRRQDFLPGPEPTVRQAVETTVTSAGLRRPEGRIALLGHPRTWGWLFNPLTVYYCFDEEEAVDQAVLEVTNTPWHERCRYVVGSPGRHTFAKRMPVSPFLPAAGTYTLRYSEPRDTLQVDLTARSDAVDGGTEVVRASMLLHRRPLDRASVTRLLWAHATQTVRVSAGIYRQALRLRARGATVYPHVAVTPDGSPHAVTTCGRNG